jgi:hypothetical protein
MSDAQPTQGDNPTLDSEELKQEEEALRDPKQEDVRTSIIEKYGLDEDSQADLIEKLTADTLEQRKSFGKVISQKRKYRELATKPSQPAPQPAPAPQQIPDVSALVAQELEKRDLESLEMPDDIKADVQKLAKALGVTVRQAARDPYILHKLEEHKRAEKAEAAAIPRTTHKGATVKFSKDNPPNPDMSTEEGRKEWDEYSEWLKTQN